MKTENLVLLRCSIQSVIGPVYPGWLQLYKNVQMVGNRHKGSSSQAQ